MDNVDPLEVWARWVAGDPTLRDAYLLGLQVFWWSRLGKFISFIAGWILLVDIIGPERILKFVDKRSAAHQKELEAALERVRQRANHQGEFSESEIRSVRRGMAQGHLIPMAAGIILVAVWGAYRDIPVFIVIWFCASFALAQVSYVYGIAILRWLYARERVIQVARMISLCTFVIGFALDLLGS